MVKKYGQTVLVTQDLALENYLDRQVGNIIFMAKYTEVAVYRILKQVNSEIK